MALPHSSFALADSAAPAFCRRLNRVKSFHYCSFQTHNPFSSDAREQASLLGLPPKLVATVAVVMAILCIRQGLLLFVRRSSVGSDHRRAVGCGKILEWGEGNVCASDKGAQTKRVTASARMRY